MSLSQHHLLHELAANTGKQNLADSFEITPSANAPSSSEHPHGNSNEDKNTKSKDGVNESCLHCYLSHFIIGDLETPLQSIFVVKPHVMHLKENDAATQFEPLTDRNKSPPFTI